MAPVKDDSSWSREDFGQLCGHEEFARTIHDFREFLSKTSWPIADISEDKLSQLIKLAYLASISSEEGQFPCFRLFVPSAPQPNKPAAFATFDPPIELNNVDRLRKLAPAAHSQEATLWCIETNGTLQCEGIFSEADDLEVSLLGRPEFVKHHQPRGFINSYQRLGLYLRIGGPGELHFTENIYQVVLRNGIIREYSPIEVFPLFESWCKELGESITAPTQDRTFGEEMRGLPLILTVISQALRQAQTRQRGGAIIIAGSEALDRIDCKFNVTELSLPNQMRLFLRACVDAWDAKKHGVDLTDYEGALGSWMRAPRELITSAELIGHLSAVDGCVLFDRDLNLRGFGGKISIRAEDANESMVRFANFENGTDEPEEELNSLGMRHKSAFWLCKACPPCIAFVISQDGDLRMFASNTEEVHYLDGALVTSATEINH